MYAAEWPCCHDPLRFSLGSDDLLRARNNPRSEPRQGLSRSSVALPALSPSRLSSEPHSLGGGAGGGESAISAQGSAQATAQTQPALPEPPLGAPAVPSGLNAASGAGGASV